MKQLSTAVHHELHRDKQSIILLHHPWVSCHESWLLVRASVQARKIALLGQHPKKLLQKQTAVCKSRLNCRSYSIHTQFGLANTKRLMTLGPHWSFKACCHPRRSEHGDANTMMVAAICKTWTRSYSGVVVGPVGKDRSTERAGYTLEDWSDTTWKHNLFTFQTLANQNLIALYISFWSGRWKKMFSEINVGGFISINVGFLIVQAEIIIYNF